MKTQLFLASLCLFVLIGCGSVSEIKSTDEGSGFSLHGYEKVVVKNFGDATTPGTKDTDKRRLHVDSVATASRVIADKISSEIRVLNLFDSVAREPLEGSYLEISGDITRYVEGNAAARLWIGMGAGSSYFDANVFFKDGTTGELIGTVKIDKNSWGLGGGLAAGQTVEHFMNRGAKKIAEQVQESMGRPSLAGVGK